MKKSILAVAVVLGAAATSFAQDDKQYLPESGDWAVGINANPFLDYFGNLIGGTGDNVTPAWNFITNNQTISGKLMASEDMAYRAALRIGFGSMSGAAMIDQDNAAAPTFPNLPTMVEDSYKKSWNNIGLSGGLEYRKNHGRLVGFYGGELGFMIGSGKTAYTYGNALTATTATGTDFSGVNGLVDVDGNPINNMAGDPVWGGGRMTEYTAGSSFGLGLRGFIGVEYFVLPRISLGGEFGWGLVFMSNGATSETWETNDGATQATIVHEGTKSSGFALDTDAMNSVFGNAAQLRMTFYF